MPTTTSHERTQHTTHLVDVAVTVALLDSVGSAVSDGDAEAVSDAVLVGALVPASDATNPWQSHDHVHIMRGNAMRHAPRCMHGRPPINAPSE